MLLLTAASAADDGVPDAPDAGHVPDAAPAADAMALPAAGDPATDPAPSAGQRLRIILDDFGIPHDPAALEDAALRAMLKTLDPRAGLMPADAAERLRRQEQGYPPDPDDETAARPQRIDDVQAEIWPRDIRYIRIRGLYAGTGDRFIDALQPTNSARSIGLIIDLRQADGRDFDSVDRIAGCFLETGEAIYAIEGLGGQPIRQGIATASPGIVCRPPTLMLIDGQTTQAAELLAAILRDTPGIMLMGAASRGDPLLREWLRWSDNQFLYLPTAEIRPTRHAAYHATGIVPHITVPRSSQPDQPAEPVEPVEPAGDRAAGTDLPEAVRNDPVIIRAVDILVGLEAVTRVGGGAKPEQAH